MYVENNDGMIYYVLQKQRFSDDDSFDLPLIYNVNGHSLHFGRREFCLVTAFKFGLLSFCEYRNGDIPFRNRLFPENIGYDVKIIDVLALLEDEEKFSKVMVDDVFLRMVNNLDAWNLFLWGEHIWRQLYDSIRNVSSKHKHKHLAVLGKNLNHVPSYSLTGFLYAFKICILECSCVSDRWWTKVPKIIPRALSWRRKAELNKFGYFGDLFHKAPIELAATKAKIQSNWYTPSNDYFICEEFHTGVCGREKGRWATLIDRVRNLEGICETLLTLPKEVKSLRGHIFKLESIIQASLYLTRVFEKEETLKKVGLQIKDFLQTTSEDEPDIKDDTSPK
nr:phospholipase-like, aminotransferase-like mobile domain protein [Tanacetum cinerariifolium]